MARQESDREDLFAELSSFSPRWELQHHSGDGKIVLGERKDGRLAIYFGPDPGFHFDDQNQLLRAYWNGVLYRTQGETLARMVRQRSDTETTLLRTDLNLEEVSEFRRRLVERLQSFQQELSRLEWTIFRDVEGTPERWDHLLMRVDSIIRNGGALAPAYATRRK